MSQNATINTMAFYHWNDTLFDLMQVPEGLEKNDIVDAILLETVDFSVTITDFDILKGAIGIWSRHRLDVWNKLYATTQLSYNPIENYRRVENGSETTVQSGYGTLKNDGGTDTTTTIGSESKQGSIEKTITGKYKDTDSGTDTTGEGVSAFNEQNVYSDYSRTTLQHGKSTERTYTNYTETENFGEPDDLMNPATKSRVTETSQKLSGTREDRNFEDERSYTSVISGNIGVTTSQQMIQAEREIDDFDIVDIIVRDYKEEFCILVY